MPRVRQEKLNEATRQEIKDTARQLMAEKGTAGLSLRAIARSMGMTAPALYHYFGSMDDLITALIVDAFSNYADYVRVARDEAKAAGATNRQQIFVALLAYREWAVMNSTDFQLIYGNPIPGYAAPAEITVPAASKMGEVFIEPLQMGIETGEIVIPAPLRMIPPGVRDHYAQKYGIVSHAAETFHLMNQIWGMMHGMVTLEIYNHTTPVVGDAEAFYEQAIRSHLLMMGVEID